MTPSREDDCECSGKGRDAGDEGREDSDEEEDKGVRTYP
jgi:hypothetical protein